MIKAFEDMLAKGSFSASKQTAARIVVSTNNCAECLEILASSGADMKELNDNSENLLHTYALLGNTPEIKADLFRKGSATWEQSGYKLPDWYKNMDMSRNASVDKMVKTLTGFGIGINEQNKDGRSPLILNLGFDGIGGANEVAISLIKNGADVKAADEKWGSAIALASKRGNVDILRAMIDAGADINTESKEYDRNSMQFVKGFTPLTIAAMRNHTEAVKFLIEKGADVNEGVEGTSTNIKSNCITTIKGKTALFYAVENNNMDLVKSLVENPSLKWKNELRIDKWKQTSTFTAENAFLKTTTTTIRCIDDGTFTASRYAKELGFKELASYLKEKGL
jgi:ankyrin repeat protein